MSGSVAFTTGPEGQPIAVGVVSEHHLPEGESALTVVPFAAIADLAAAGQWQRLLGIDLRDLPVLPQLQPVAARQLVALTQGPLLGGSG